MDFFIQAWDFFINLLLETETTLDALIQHSTFFVYAVLFLIIFAETGFVVTPFLPGDSLLFLAGMFANRATNDLNIIWIIILLSIAAILGDGINYTIGRFFGIKLFSNPDSKIFKQSHLDKTNAFYKKHGGKTIILARFVPIVRTFAPFVAGMGKMNYNKFGFYNIIGGITWIVLFTLLGYFTGGLDIVQKNVKIIILLIIIVSILPAIIEYFRTKSKNTKEE